MFVGKFETCNDFSLVNGANAIVSRDMCIGNTIDSTYGDNVLVPRVWSKYGQTFDNIGYGLATLFEVTSMNSWSVVMYNSVDIVGEDMQPFPGHSPVNSLYFIAFVFLSSMFVLQMFVAVIVDSFYHVHGFFDRTDEQSQMRNLTLLLEMMKPREVPDPPEITPEMSGCLARWQSLRKIVYDMVLLPGETAPNYKQALLYDHFVTGMLCINVAFMLTRHFPR